MGKDDKVTGYDFKQSRKDDDNLSLAGRGWGEPTNDEAVEFVRGIRDDVESEGY